MDFLILSVQSDNRNELLFQNVDNYLCISRVWNRMICQFERNRYFKYLYVGFVEAYAGNCRSWVHSVPDESIGKNM